MSPAKKQLLPSDLAVEAFSSLREREAEVMRLRLGFNQSGRRLTLEEIGREFKITRERVRQIENEAVRQLTQRPTRALKRFFEAFRAFMRERGGLITLSEAFSFFPAVSLPPALLEESSLRLLLRLNPQVSALKGLSGEQESFYLTEVLTLERIKELASKIEEALKQASTPLSAAEVAKRISEAEVVVRGILSAIGLFGQTRDGRFGLKDWPEISPKRIGDKIYLVLKEAASPLHFRQIAERIGDAHFSRRPVLSRTVHNELICDPRFVLVGRGIYALSEWGYQPGVVAEVIEKVLRQAGRPLQLREIVEGVLKERLVKKNTIVANLQAKRRFRRVGKATYALADEQENKRTEE